MRLVENILRCYECRKEFSSEEVETVTRDGKRYAVCPNCEFETPILEKKR
jgi:DNA-directed RNA polymerase subunit RPC12/RpoP